ncbi:kelch repeat-containing protein [Flavisolibacter tropicus]|uniref:Fibronectin type-III domain-containing protein n=1 Tax=Flavisolibacter tropicus TaxID=1492898 RepID=A0A172TXH6_9BACT|nr:kelch repeat-containing protein [Flavisolibacter tropicus]ANE51437.1 hypothetical protein SY85_13910 [Flavisolibacter tropicus]
MKNAYQHLLLILICGFISPVFAQTPVYIGKVNDVRTTYSTKARAAAANRVSSETMVSHSIPGEPPLLLKIVSSRQDQAGVFFYGEVKDAASGRFYLRVVNGQASGAITILDQKKYYRYSSKADGSVYLTEEDIDKVMCVGLPKAKEATGSRGQNSQSTTANSPAAAALEPAPLLESLPGAISVLYLDFDGETVINTEWNRNYTNGEPIVAAPSSFTASEMTEIWKSVSEDFLPFALNVTTDVAVFNRSAPNTRMRIVFTPTQAWFPGSVGGVAYIGSFTWGGDAFRGETPCWDFNTEVNFSGEVASHEAGHTVGLHHDGRTDPPEEYYYGDQSWAPIMGLGYAKPLVQWSKGEYLNASNTEDDLNIITTLNGFGYRTDDHGNTRATATALVMDASGNIAATANKGIISTPTDVDVFSLTSTGGKIAFTVNPAPKYSNLNLSVTLSNAAGTVIASHAPLLDPAAAISATVTPGTYYITIDGVQGGLGASSDYGSLGAYTITQGKDYCTPVYSSGCESFLDLVNNFSFNTLVNNNSGCTSNANSYSVYAPTGTLTTTVNRGQSYPLKIQGDADEPQNFAVWIDYNQDNDFDDAGEFVYATTGGNVILFSATITIPATAALGPTRLRVRSNYEPMTSIDYCRRISWGEAEDYTITIVGDGAPITLSEPANGAIYVAPATINLAATTSNNGGTIAKVEFFNNNTKLGEDPTAPYTFSWTDVPAGAYTLTALVTYNSGLSSISDPVSVTVQSLITVSSIAPSSGAAGVGVVIKGDNFLNETTVRFGGVEATEVYVASPQLIYATVPAGAVTGSVQVVSGIQTVQATGNFTVAPIASVWANKAGTLTARAQYGAVAANGRIYVFGGYNSTGLLNSLEIYNPVTNTWTAGAPMPGAARGVAATLGTDGSIYVFGGFIETVSTAVYRYTPSANSWTTLTNMPIGIWEAATATAANGKIYLFGGQQTSNGNAFNSLTRIYDVATDTWSQGANMPVAVKQHSAVTAADGKIYLFGGRTGANEPQDVVQIYNPATDTWTTGAPMIIPKVQFGTVSATDGRIYIVGGKARINSNTGPFFHTVEIYDPETNTWTEGPVIPAQTGELKAVNVDGNLYAIGGTNGAFRNYNFQLAFTPLAPLAPTELAATAVSATQIDLAWTDRADNETQYTVERATAADGPYTVVATLGANTQAYANSGLLPGTHYYYRVRCSNTAGNSDYSNTANATTQEVVTDSDFDIVHGNKGTLSGVTSLTVYPNPVRNTAHIDLAVSKNLQINLTIYDHKGNVVKQLYNGAVNAGAKYQFSWNAAGKANGAYWLQLTTATGVMTRKIVVAPGGKK